MIGMMYLVLTALLALNVSADILNAFVLVDESLIKATEVFVEKNSTSYEIFDAQMDKAAAKVGPFRDTAYMVKEKADQLAYDIQQLKVKLIRFSDGADADAFKEKDEHGKETGKELEISWAIGGGDTPKPSLKTFNYDGMHIHSKDATDKPAQMMILEQRGDSLKKKIVEYREFLVSLVRKNDAVKHAIENVLNTDDPPEQPGHPPHSWESSLFEHLPLVAVITNLSKIQNDVRNAESNILGYLLDKIDATDTKVNKMEAVVLTKSNYVLKGGQFEARVLLAAYDSLQRPNIYLGKPRRTAEGGWEIDGGGTLLPYDAKGRAMVIRPGSAVGNYSVEGVLQMQTPDGIRNYPFISEYQVGEAGAVISPTKMNVMYIGVDNPLSISVSGVPAEKVSASMTNGTLSKVRGSEYTARPSSSGTASVSVFAEIEGSRKPMGSMEFRIKMLPMPEALVGGKSNGNIEKNLLLAQTGVQASMGDFLFDLKYTVVSFDMTVVTPAGERSARSGSAAFSS